MKWIFVLRKQIGSTTFVQNLKKIDAKEPIFFFTFYLKLFLEISNFSEMCSKIFKFQDIFWILKKFRKMTFYQFVESKGEMVFGFGKTHYFNHIFPKFCKNCRRATNFFWFTFWKQLLSFVCVFCLFFCKKTKTCLLFEPRQKICSFSSKKKISFCSNNILIFQQHAYIVCIHEFRIDIQIELPLTCLIKPKKKQFSGTKS